MTSGELPGLPQALKSSWTIRECYVYRSEKERPHFRRKDENVVLELIFREPVKVCKAAVSAEPTPVSIPLSSNKNRIVREPTITYEGDTCIRITTNLNSFGRFFRPSQNKSKEFKIVVECCLRVGETHEHGSLGYYSPAFSVLGRNAFRARTPRSRKTDVDRKNQIPRPPLGPLTRSTSQPLSSPHSTSSPSHPVEPIFPLSSFPQSTSPTFNCGGATPRKLQLTPLVVYQAQENEGGDPDADAEIRSIWRNSPPGTAARRWYRYRGVQPPSPGSPRPASPFSTSPLSSPSPPLDAPLTPSTPMVKRGHSSRPGASPCPSPNQMALLIPSLEIRTPSPHLQNSIHSSPATTGRGITLSKSTGNLSLLAKSQLHRQLRSQESPSQAPILKEAKWEDVDAESAGNLWLSASGFLPFLPAPSSARLLFKTGTPQESPIKKELTPIKTTTTTPSTISPFASPRKRHLGDSSDFDSLKAHNMNLNIRVPSSRASRKTRKRSISSSGSSAPSTPQSQSRQADEWWMTPAKGDGLRPEDVSYTIAPTPPPPQRPPIISTLDEKFLDPIPPPSTLFNDDDILLTSTAPDSPFTFDSTQTSASSTPTPGSSSEDSKGKSANIMCHPASCQSCLWGTPHNTPQFFPEVDKSYFL